MIHVPNRVPVLTAPTAAGKTALALALGRRLPLEVVSADAFLVYRGMDVGTAKPTLAERALVPHHLIDLIDPHEDYDVTRFVHDAEAAIADILARGRMPLVVGGTGFYVQALVSGLPTTPPADLSVQASLEAELHEVGLDALIARVEAVRPSEVARLQRNPRRVIRALELHRRTGRFPSEFKRTTPRFAYDVVAFTLPPAELEARIVARVDDMFARGLVEETTALLRQLPTGARRPTALQAIGYKEVARVLDGTSTLEEARVAVVTATRSLAKRQLTWIRTQLRVPVHAGVAAASAELAGILHRDGFHEPDLS